MKALLVLLALIAVAFGEDTQSRHAVSLVGWFVPNPMSDSYSPFTIPLVTYEFSINEKHSLEAFTIPATSFIGLKYNRTVGSFRLSLGYSASREVDFDKMFDFTDSTPVIIPSVEHRFAISEHWYTKLGGGGIFVLSRGMLGLPFLHAGIGYAI
ncbi:MAG: hypothetical protein KAR40_17705 [Candidatus Sabulitectum sp.]|nr:hypothetical protein [Candidatus Sabulitectum sp.]